MTNSVLENFRSQNVIVPAPPRIEVPPPDIGVAETQKRKWVEQTLEQLKEKNLYSREKIALIENFPPECADYYKNLQEEIAKQYPLEEERPFFCLTFGQGPHKIGMAGGMGPLSDATMLEKLFERMNAEELDNFSGVMYSMPPPRSFWKKITSFWQFSGLYKSVREALPCTSLYILSNTGHLMKIAWEIDSLFGGRELGAVDDMTEKVSDKIKLEQKNGRVLILGTNTAAEHELYQKLLVSRGLQPVVPTGEYEDEQSADYLQKIIDQVKAGNVNQKVDGTNLTYGDKFVDFVVNFAKKEPTCKSMLFSCTELPMLLDAHPEASQETYFDKLKKQLGKEDMIYHDSEEIFVDSIQMSSTKLQEKITLHKKNLPNYDSVQLNNCVSLEQSIEKHLQSFQYKFDTKSLHKKYVLAATLKYLKEPNEENRAGLEAAKKINSKFNESLWSSKTADLVNQAEKMVETAKSSSTCASHINFFNKTQPTDPEQPTENLPPSSPFKP